MHLLAASPVLLPIPQPLLLNTSRAPVGSWLLAQNLQTPTLLNLEVEEGCVSSAPCSWGWVGNRCGEAPGEPSQDVNSRHLRHAAGLH